MLEEPIAAILRKRLVALMRGTVPVFGNYTQIMAYQIEEQLITPGSTAARPNPPPQQLALAAAHALRNAERDALDGSGLSATPLMASASFILIWFPLARIAGRPRCWTRLYSQAYQALSNPYWLIRISRFLTCSP